MSRVIPPRSERDWLTSTEVMIECDVSYRQLVWWSMNGYIKGQEEGPGSGYDRRWTDEQVARVKEIKEAIDKAEAVLASAGLPSARMSDKSPLWMGR